MKTATKENQDIKISIKQKGEKPINFHLWELKNVCWDYIYELERGNPAMYLTDHELLDSLMQNYFACKLVYTELGQDISGEMKEIESFVSKHQTRIFLSTALTEVNNSLPRLNFSCGEK